MAEITCPYGTMPLKFQVEYIVCLTLIHICGVRADPGKLYQVLLQPFSNSGPMLCIPFKLQYFVFGVRADPAATKLVSFFVNVYEG